MAEQKHLFADLVGKRSGLTGELINTLANNVTEFARDPAKTSYQRLSESFPAINMTVKEMRSPQAANTLLQSFGFGGILGKSSDDAVRAYNAATGSDAEKWVDTGVMKYTDGADTHFISDVTNPNEMAIKSKGANKLGDLVDYPSLFDRHPDMRNIDVQYASNPSYNHAANRMTLNQHNPKVDLLQQIEHEAGHGVQYRENLPVGTSTNLMRGINKLNNGQPMKQAGRSSEFRHNQSLNPTVGNNKRLGQGFPENWNKNPFASPAERYLNSGGEALSNEAMKRARMTSGQRMMYKPDLPQNPLFMYGR